MEEMVFDTLREIGDRLSHIQFNGAQLDKEIRQEVERGFVSRETAAEILVLLATDIFHGIWTPGITPYAIGVALARSLGTTFARDEMSDILTHIGKGFNDKLAINFRPEAFLR